MGGQVNTGACSESSRRPCKGVIRCYEKGNTDKEEKLDFKKTWFKKKIILLLVYLFDHHARTVNLLTTYIFPWTPWVCLGLNYSEYENWWPNAMYSDANGQLQNLTGYWSYDEGDCFLFLQFRKYSEVGR